MYTDNTLEMYDGQEHGQWVAIKPIMDCSLATSGMLILHI